MGDPDSDIKNAKFFRGRPSKPCICIRFSITACPTHLKGQTNSDANIRLISTIFVCYNFWVIRIPTSKMPNFFVDVHQDLVYAYDCPSRLVRPIWRVKRAPKRACASFPTHFEGQTSPEASIRLISTIFICYSTPIFWVIRIPTSKMPNFFVDVRQDVVYAYGWPSRVFWALEGQTSPGASIRLILTIFVCYCTPFFG